MMNNSPYQDYVADLAKRGDRANFALGYLGAALKFNVQSAPGVKITNQKAYLAWAEQLIATADSEAKRLMR